MTDNGRPYFAMEHVPGIPLTQYCTERQFTIRQRLELFVPICQAVQHPTRRASFTATSSPRTSSSRSWMANPCPR
jgi:hypothetical protein